MPNKETPADAIQKAVALSNRRRERLAERVDLIEDIERQVPEARSSDHVKGLIAAELRRLERESDCDLDAIAEYGAGIARCRKQEEE